MGIIRRLSQRGRIRAVNTRNGIVLSGAGGALGRMLLPWKIGGVAQLVEETMDVLDFNG